MPYFSRLYENDTKINRRFYMFKENEYEFTLSIWIYNWQITKPLNQRIWKNPILLCCYFQQRLRMKHFIVLLVNACHQNTWLNHLRAWWFPNESLFFYQQWRMGPCKKALLSLVVTFVAVKTHVLVQPSKAADWQMSMPSALDFSRKVTKCTFL